MKYSKRLTQWQRKLSWGVFRLMEPKMRNHFCNNRFETFCKNAYNGTKGKT